MACLLPLAALPALAGCEAEGTAGGPAEYLGVATRLLDGDLVDFEVAMRGGSAEAATRYAACAAAQYALVRGYGFARHVRTLTEEEGGIWRADAVYTISAALPEGLATIDAEVAVAECAQAGIPTV
ncbi:hypothetical protein [Pseudoroseicyclus sp. CXY001]|uniref:hypothetical protein n=1 Tax=Pseudoroseicyclus sp. CXY001 TaxID=3242492 RepID=UPI00358DCAEF